MDEENKTLNNKLAKVLIAFELSEAQAKETVDREAAVASRKAMWTENRADYLRRARRLRSLLVRQGIDVVVQKNSDT